MVDMTKNMTKQIANNKFHYFGAVDSVIELKKYISLLIRKKIFRKEDIYGKVFKSEKDFADFKKLWEKYQKARDAAKAAKKSKSSS
jgi:uncharacterized protein YfbU (UPF0304 family)